MQTPKPTKKLSLFLAVAALTGSVLALDPMGYYQPAMENEFIQALNKKLKTYTTAFPEDRVYLQLDKPFYEPGNDIWLAAYVRDGVSLRPSTKSDIVYVELINPKGSVEKSVRLIAKGGKAAGDFSIDKEAPGGLYKVRAYTKWMKNEGEKNVFEKEIQVQEVILPNLKMKLDFERKAFGAGDEVIAKLELNTNENQALANHKVKFVANLGGKKLLEQSATTDEEGHQYLRFKLPDSLNTNDGLLNVMIDYNGSTESVSRAIPIVLNTIDLTLYPEGGDLVSGLETNVAFRALNEFGKPADVEGVVLTEKGSRVASFSSFHQGMGAFHFLPQPGERYEVKITKPEGVKKSYRLPEVLSRGYVMNINSSKEGEIGVDINTTESTELSLVAQMRGKMYYTTVIHTRPGHTTFSFPTHKFPMGVSQITLFDSKGIARAERLAFVNKSKQMNISIDTDKEKYLPREKVTMTLSVKDEDGLPMPANLSLAVVNDQLLSFADDKSGHILSQLMLEQDLNCKVEEPSFYFSKKEEKADRALDYLLMTAGWRRFTWEKLLNEPVPVINYLGERTLISGIVMDANTGKPLKDIKVKTPQGAVYSTDANGKFSIRHLELYSPVNLQLTGLNVSPQNLYVTTYDESYQVYMYSNTPNKYRIATDASTSEGVPDMDQMVAAPPVMMEEAEVMRMPVADHREVKDFPKKEKAVRKEERAKPVAVPVGAAAPVFNFSVAKNDIANISAASPVNVVSANFSAPIVAMKKVRMPAHNHGFFGDSAIPNNAPGEGYYRARQFAAPVYNKQETIETRSDFRNTIYWNPSVEVGFSGKKTLEFYTSDDITSFRTTVEGIGSDGLVGHAEKNFFSQLPFAMSTKIPVEVATEDIVSIPLTLKNNTNGPLGGLISITAPEGLTALAKVPEVQTIMPGAAKTIYLDYKVSDKMGVGDFTIGFKACGLGDAFTQTIRIVPKGFPEQASFSAQAIEKEFAYDAEHIVNGSLRVSLTAFPNVVSDLMKGVEGILQEPYGCFEQTSCTAYPNAMVLDYLKNTNSTDTKSMTYASDLLDRGYKRLTSFEASEKGYEWFGANPAHEGLTAYGLMEFTDMQKAGQKVDPQMLERTSKWLLSRKNGKGGFQREQHAYHSFGQISESVLNGYIVYALADAGIRDIEKEFEASYNDAMESKDPYKLGMLANAAYSLNKTAKGDAALNALLAKQDKDGSFTGSTHSITYSQGISLKIETTSLAILAMLKSPDKHMDEMNKAVQSIVASRSGSGVFGSTQGTVLALKAMTEFAKFSKRTTEDGTIVVYIDGEKAAERHYKAGETGAITIAGLETVIKGEGYHVIKVKYLGVKQALPYSVAVNWNTSLPSSDKECSIGLTTQLASTTAKVGETVRMTATITNRKQEEVPSTMAIIGIPAGFTAQAWQLKELQEKHIFDYYEIKGNNIAIYYRGLPANAVKTIGLDLKAEMPGEYEAPASSAYLYYMNEYKTWTALDKIIIKKSNS